MAISQKESALYIFIDEAGNLDFSKKGTKFFVLSSLTVERPFSGYNELIDLKYNLVEYGLDIESFHASEDRQPIRDRVFDTISKSLINYRLDSLIIEKKKTNPNLQEGFRFYPEMIGYLLQLVLDEFDINQYSEIIVFTDTIPLSKKRNLIQKETKRILKLRLPATAKFRVMHHSSKSNICLQIIDYCNWAIFRKWERLDLRSYSVIEKGIRTEIDIFKSNSISYY